MLFGNACQFKALLVKKEELTLKEKSQIIKANTARLNITMGFRSKEVVRLCNLARRHPETLKKYVKIRYGQAYAERRGITSLHFYKDIENVPYLKPSSLLWASAKFHAVVSGITGYQGHRGMFPRLICFGNWNCLIPGVLSGENCFYGLYKPVDLVIGWLESPGHRQNILRKDFYRIGVAGAFHFSKFHYNMVQNFSGPKIRDALFRPQIVFRKK